MFNQFHIWALMKKYKSFGHKLPSILSNPLFGRRKECGLIPIENDPSWQEWQKTYHSFYKNTQKKGIGNTVNNSGYKVFQKINLDGLNILEVGPGGLYHTKYWQGVPKHYILVDIDEKFLEISSSKLNKMNIKFERRLTTRKKKGALPAKDGEIDLIVSFYAIEHLNPLENHIKEMLRVLKPGGKIIGAIPAEGGFAWGLGRFLTSRRWVKKNTTVDYDKVICWEHPNFADHILNVMSLLTSKNKISFWPLKAPLIDFNLVIKFIFEK